MHGRPITAVNNITGIVPFRDFANVSQYAASAHLYKMESGALTTDSIGTSTLTNTNSVVSASGGMFGNCADFGAANTNKSLNRNMTPTANPWTISGWLNITTAITTGIYTIFARQYYTALQPRIVLQYEYNSGNPRLRFRWEPNGKTGTNVNYNINLSSGIWWNFMMTYQGNAAGQTFKGYLNGNEIMSATLVSNATASGTDYPLVFGMYCDSTSNPFKGKMDDIQTTWAYSSAVDARNVFSKLKTFHNIAA